MTGDEHRREAERLMEHPLVMPEEIEGRALAILAKAQVHATLALVAAVLHGKSRE